MPALWPRSSSPSWTAPRRGSPRSSRPPTSTGSRLTFVLTTDGHEFRRYAWSLLQARLDCNVLATVLLGELEGRYHDIESRFAYRLDSAPEHRSRGYAGMAVAEASRRALAAGASQVILFTDLANPTSNKIYAEVGYRRFGDWEEYEFGHPRPRS